MEKTSKLRRKATAKVQGIYLTDYERIVKPHQRFLVSNYFIHYWLRKLHASLAWIIVSLRQACWRAENDTCTISQINIGNEIGLTNKTVGIILNTNPFRHWFIPEIKYQKGVFDQKGKTIQPLPNRYTVHLSDPLTPEHLAGFYAYLQTTCPDRSPVELEEAITNLLSLESKESLRLLETHCQQTELIFDKPIALVEVIKLAIDLDIATLSTGAKKEFDSQLDKLQTHLTEIGSTVCRQYFRLEWVPRLGPSLAWLIMVLRSKCYFNEETEELRDVNTWDKKDLVQALGQSTSNLSKLLGHPYASFFFTVLEQNKRKITIKQEMKQEPLVNSEKTFKQPKTYAKNQEKLPITPSENQEKSPITLFENREKLPITPSENQEKLPIITLESRKSSNHLLENQEKLPPCNKYLGDSVPDVVDGGNSGLQEILAAAGLTGPGLKRLCTRTPPLDMQTVRAVLLYAQANNLGPGYIFRSLEDGDVVDELFQKFAELDDTTLYLFQQALSELRINGTIISEIMTFIPETLIDIFGQFAEAFTGVNASTVVATLKQKNSPSQKTILPPELIVTNDLAIFWAQVLNQLQLQMPRQTFDTWLNGSQLVARDGLCFIVSVSSDFAKDWLQNRLLATIRRAVISQMRSEERQEQSEVEVAFVVSSIKQI